MKRYPTRAVTAVVAAALCVGLLLSACSSGPEKKKAGGASSDALRLSACLVGRPETLDPIRKNNAAGQTVLANVYENLMRVAPGSSGKTRVIYGAAKSYKKKSNYDGTVTYTFLLRDSRWTDGKDVTAENFAYAWKRLADPATKSPYAALLSNVVGYRAVQNGGSLSKLKIETKGKSVLAVTLTGECPWFLSDVCTAAATVPLRRDILKKLKKEAGKAEKEGRKIRDGWCFAPDRLITNGPYRIAAYTAESGATLKTNPCYTGTFSGPGTIRLTFADTAEKGWALYSAGKTDFISQLPEKQTAALAKRRGWEPQAELSVGVLLFNTRKAPFSNPQVCQAFAKAVNRTALSEEVGAAAAPAAGLIPYGVPETSKKSFRAVGGDLMDCNPENYEAECRDARDLLEKAGYDAGSFPSVKLVCTQATESTAKTLAKMLGKALDADFRVNCVSEKKAASALKKGQYTMAVTEVTALVNDAEGFLAPWSSKNGGNAAGYKNSAYDTLLTVIGSASDEQARRGCLHDAESLLLEDCPLTPLYFNGTSWKLREKLTGLSRDSRGWFIFDQMAETAAGG